MATRRARVKLAPNLGLARNKAKPVTKPKIIVQSDTEHSDAEAISDLDGFVPHMKKDNETSANTNGFISDSNSNIDEATKPANALFGSAKSPVETSTCLKLSSVETPVETNEPALVLVTHCDPSSALTSSVESCAVKATPSLVSSEEPVSVLKSVEPVPALTSSDELTPALISSVVTDQDLTRCSLVSIGCPLESTSITSVVDSNSSSTVFNIVTTRAQPISRVNGIAALNDDEASDWEDDQFTYKSIEVNENDEVYKSLDITPLNIPVSQVIIENENNSKSSSVCNGDLEKSDPKIVSTTNTEQAAVSTTNTEQAAIPTVNLNTSLSSKVRLPRGKNKFKPNLNFDRRSRNTSGGSGVPRNNVMNGVPKSRPRNVSGSSTSTSSEPLNNVANGMPKSRTRNDSGSSTSSEPDDVQASVPSPKASIPPSPIHKEATSTSLTPKPTRVRRNTEGRSNNEKSQFMRRKLDHKKKFMMGVPERQNMTMFDLIYYNPEHGQKMSVEEDEEMTVDDPDNANQQVLNGEHAPVPPEPPVLAAAPEENALPVPQVKVGQNGEIILDETSLQLETTEQKKAKDLLHQTPVIFENSKTSTNYGTWSKKRRHSDWSEKETIKFYRALSVVGSDFSMMESIFKSKRTRQELKLKFKKEEKLNNKIIDKCLKERGMYTDLDDLMEDSEDDVEEEKTKGKKCKKKRPRRRYKNRGYYDSSSADEVEEVEISRPPARKRSRVDSREDGQMVRIKRPQVMHRENHHKSHRTAHPPEAVSISQLAQPSPQAGISTVQLSQGQMQLNNGVSGVPLPNGLPGVQFPPGLLAANPSLVGAQPGSLVVVASPNKSDPSSKLLHVYMVSAKSKEKLERERSSSPRTVGTPSPGSRLTLDPAVVRAVDRSRWVDRARSESGGRGQSRVRTMSEAGGNNNMEKNGYDHPPRTRQRTYSEGGMAVRGVEGTNNLRTETIKKRFLSGSARSYPGPLTSSTTPSVPAFKASQLPIAKKSKPTEQVVMLDPS